MSAVCQAIDLEIGSGFDANDIEWVDATESKSVANSDINTKNTIGTNTTLTYKCIAGYSVNGIDIAGNEQFDRKCELDGSNIPSWSANVGTCERNFLHKLIDFIGITCSVRVTNL